MQMAGKVEKSTFLSEHKLPLKELIEKLKKHSDYVSILASDSGGIQYRMSGKSASMADSRWSDRGFVARLFKDGRVYEYSFNSLAGDIFQRILTFIENSPGLPAKSFSPPKEEQAAHEFLGEYELDPFTTAPKVVFGMLKGLFDEASAQSDKVFNAQSVFESVKVSKYFLSAKKELEQHYLWSQAYLVPMARRGEQVKVLFKAESGMCGLELLNNMKEGIPHLTGDLEALLQADPVAPGEYEVVCAPDITGVLAHEAFGHGVEMDMFVKKRALGAEHIGNQVASELVTMRDGAKSIHQVASFLFDDEGNFGKDTVIIEKGILTSGISDSLSAAVLNTEPTGNGRRQSYKNKTYSRMTNTVIDPGSSTVEEMISSIKHGYYLDYMNNGMEDPKNWGLQVVASMGKEIKDGKFTGKVVSPVIMTGFVPDILKNISMVGKDCGYAGSGMCGKGWKEWVKVSSGGPHVKTRLTLS
jgi:TldD protein